MLWWSCLSCRLYKEEHCAGRQKHKNHVIATWNCGSRGSTAAFVCGFTEANLCWIPLETSSELNGALEVWRGHFEGGQQENAVADVVRFCREAFRACNANARAVKCTQWHYIYVPSGFCPSQNSMVGSGAIPG